MYLIRHDCADYNNAAPLAAAAGSRIFRRRPIIGLAALPTRRIVKLISRALLLCVVLALPAVAQQVKPALKTLSRSANSPQIAPKGQREEPLGPRERDLQRQQRVLANKERQASLKRDTDRLLQLATELKLYVDKTNENVLSLSVIRKTDEIEKLARSIREKMKNAY
jgi:hypothetical protein